MRAQAWALRRRRSPRGQRSGGGFTLVEVLVALGIAAISLTASLRATSTMMMNNEQMRSRLLAVWSAENQMALIRLEQRWPDVGLTRFDCPQAALALNCRQRVTQMPYREIRAVELEVFDAQGHRLARLVGFAKSN